jgi:hypothetical protein
MRRLSKALLLVALVHANAHATTALGKSTLSCMAILWISPVSRKAAIATKS